MTWEISAAANAVIGIAYLVIAYIILGGLIRTNQLTSNKLGLATGLIFLTCGVHHGTPRVPHADPGLRHPRSAGA